MYQIIKCMYQMYVSNYQMYDQVTLNSMNVPRNFAMSVFSKAIGYYKAISYHSLCDMK